MRMEKLKQILSGANPGQRGIFSVCTANELVIRAAVRHARRHGYTVAIEATANQVNQDGGYTGMTPADYAAFVRGVACEEGLDPGQLILGGDHLGPLTWSALPEAEAMERSEILIRDYVEAGFGKIHIDTSMRLGGDAPGAPLDVAVCARRGARLAKALYAAFERYAAAHPGAERPSLVIGSEVPIPGGSREHEDFVAPTPPEEFERQLAEFRAAFDAERLPFGDVAAFVVQPGVEFGDDFVCQYHPERAAPLMAAIARQPGLVFEGHSTDYQTRDSLTRLVGDGVRILKVGPGLTFALREALMLLEHVEKALCAGPPSAFTETLLHTMDGDGRYWKKYYTGSAQEIAYKKLYSYSDRCRYYLPAQTIQDSAGRLLSNLGAIPEALLSLYFPRQYEKVMRGVLEPDARSVLFDRIGDVLDAYAAACGVR